jgi:TDG/mug DNA glycosylase family protein
VTQRERRRPGPVDLAAAEGREIPDVIAPDLDILFCGINPGRWSGATGHHFAHPGNRFWKALFAAGLTRELLSPDQGDQLLEMGLGVTNLVRRTTASAAELTRDELREGARTLARTVGRWRPRVVAVLGLIAYRRAFDRPGAAPGEQPERLGDARLWVLPNPSGLQGRYRLEDIVAELQNLRRAVDGRAGPGRTIDPSSERERPAGV